MPEKDMQVTIQITLKPGENYVMWRQEREDVHDPFGTLVGRVPGKLVLEFPSNSDIRVSAE